MPRQGWGAVQDRHSGIDLILHAARDRVASRVEDIVAMTSAYADLLTQRSRASIAGGKQMVSGVLSGLTVDDPELRRLRMENFLGSDLKEGVRAFLEKRAPSFS